jgi:leucyl-tRNA synthetase
MDFAKIEKKWQKRWEDKKAFVVSEKSKKKKCYVLEQLPYTSGSGLHMGHAFTYTIGDIYARYKIMKGFNVLHPIGYDSFGLPAENAAIKAKAHPKKFTETAIKNFEDQLKALGFSYDWTRKLSTHKPDFYKWDQWIFLKMLEKDLAYKRSAPVNWCGKCNTVLANEQVVNGKCWRHEDTDVVVKKLEQWFLKITEYADELNEKLNELRGYPELIKTLQKNWIGKSHGVEIEFEINGYKWPIFTTRPDTLFGVTFMVVSAQHSKLMELVTKEQRAKVDKFLKKIKSVSEKNYGEIDKEGVYTGSYARNPLSGEKIPIWVGNFVVADYGSGMVMAVPAHDQRDYEFAKKYGIEIREVVKNKESTLDKRAFSGEGVLVNSKGFDGLKTEEAREHVVNALKMKKVGKKTVNFRLRDWLISRQRFWGTPIPIIYCDKCGVVPVPERDLPVELPDNIKFKSEENPLVSYDRFVNAKCPKCKGKAKRETDTMDTFVNSSWYFLRYCDSQNSKKIFDTKKVDYWCPIDIYIGGKEHACMHDIYFRFYTKFLRDIGVLNFSEPAKRLFNQGFIYGSDGRKMSKSYGNVIVPTEASKKYGVDAMRMFLVSVASPEKDFNWSDKGAEGSLRFVKKVIEYFGKVKKGKSSKKVEHKVNKAIKEITFDIESLKYNFAVIKLRALFENLELEISRKDLESFVKMLSVFCPHIGEELWEKLGNKKFVSLSDWPEFDEGKIDEGIEREEQFVSKTIESINNIKKITNIENPKVYIYSIPNELDIYKKNKEKIKTMSGALLVEAFAVNDKDKYDPEGKANKAKPGRPGIYIK